VKFKGVLVVENWKGRMVLDKCVMEILESFFGDYGVGE